MVSSTIGSGMACAEDVTEHARLRVQFDSSAHHIEGTDYYQ
jgi:hypothetical protein